MTARFRLTIDMSMMKAEGPCLAAWPDICAMPTGPVRDFAEMRRSTMPSRKRKIRPALRTFSWTDSRRAPGRERRDVTMFNLGSTYAPITQRAGPSAPLHTGCTVTCMGLPLRWNSIVTGLPPLPRITSWKRTVAWIGWPLALRIKSPCWNPTFCAGMPEVTGPSCTSPFSDHPAFPTPLRSSSTGVTVVSNSLPLRAMVNCMGRAALSTSLTMMSSQVGLRRPPNLTMRSPSWMPALAAGVAGVTAPITAPLSASTTL